MVHDLGRQPLAGFTHEKPEVGQDGRPIIARPRRRSEERPLPNRRASLPGWMSNLSDLMRWSWGASAMRTRLAALATLVAISAFIALGSSPFIRSAPGLDREAIGAPLGSKPGIAASANASVDDLARPLRADGISPRDLAALLGISGF